MPLKLSYSFEVPYLIRVNEEPKFWVLIDGQRFKIQVKNPDGFEFLPWLKGEKSAASNLVFMHPEEHFNLDTSTHRSEIIISFKIQGIKALKSMPSPPVTIIQWSKEKKIEFKYADQLLEFFHKKIVKVYDRFLKVFTFFTKEIYNAGYIEPIYQSAFPFGVKIFIDDMFKGIFFPTINISLIPLDNKIKTQIEDFLKAGKDINSIDDLIFQSFVAYQKRRVKHALLLCAEYLEMFINHYLLQSNKLEFGDRGTIYAFLRGRRRRKEFVGTLRKYDAALNDFKGVSLVSNKNLWDDLDKIVQLRNRIIHRYESKYVESRYHYRLRDSTRQSPKIECNVDLEQEFSRLFSSANKIVQWVSNV